MTKNKTEPLVSVIMPGLNVGNFVEEAAKSILGQTYKNIEVILLDDGSDDNTWEALKRLKELDKRVAIHRHKENLGVGLSRNEMIGLAKGEFIAWQDCDDISLPNRIEEQVKFLLDNPKVGVVGSYIEFFNDNGSFGVRKYPKNDPELRKIIFRYNPLAQPASMFRKECFEKVGGYNPAYRVSEDLDMFLKVGTKYEFGNVQKVLLKYRENPGSLTFSRLREMEKITISLRFNYRNHEAYHFGVIDYIYNALQFLSIYLMPAKLKIKIFSFLRNSK